MFQRTLIRQLAGIVAVLLLVAASVEMVRNPAFFGGDMRTDRLFRERPADFVACGSRLEYDYEARTVGDDGGAREVRLRYEQTAIAAAKGRLLYQFRALPNGDAALFATYELSGALVGIYSAPQGPRPPTELTTIALAFGKALERGGVQRVAEFPVEDYNVLGRAKLTQKTKLRPDVVLRCVERSADEEARAAGLIVTAAR